jgi:hypothetical protein
MDCSGWLHGSTVVPEPALGLDGRAVKCAGNAEDKVIDALKQRPEASLIDFGAVSKLVQAMLP